jgi:hypothetical protein
MSSFSSSPSPSPSPSSAAATAAAAASRAAAVPPTLRAAVVDGAWRKPRFSKRHAAALRKASILAGTVQAGVPVDAELSLAKPGACRCRRTAFDDSVAAALWGGDAARAGK